MAQDVQVFEKKLRAFMQEFEGLLAELVEIRRQSPQVKGETAKILEQYMIDVSKLIKQISKEHNDDLMEGVSFLKIKFMG